MSVSATLAPARTNPRGTVSSVAVVEKSAEGYLSLHALDAATGSLKWQYETGEELSFATASNGRIYVPSFGNLVSLDASTGSPDWQGGYSTVCGPLIASDGVLYGRATHNSRYLIFAIRAP